MITVKYEDLDGQKIKDLIKQKQTFEVLGLSGRMDSATAKVENMIETSGLSCRVYTYGRIAAAGASLFGGITGVVGVASAIGMAAHNIATYNPDYEIAKHRVDNKLTVKYKK
ncbi:hypothetical protein [Psychrobacter piscatorii]|uniref:hypothetical protein n=1 Tax=Psychrobacter piscatorii TaxID=554343 RepID=UPI00191AA555|nr:hypothetical protein [Psychrobacter piscatorii]